MRLPIRTIVTTLLLMLLCAAAAAQECQRHSEADGRFSICTPDGWTIKSADGQKYKIIYGPIGREFTANINFKDEVNSSLLPQYVAASTKTILENYSKIGATSVKVLEQNEFVTSSGIRGLRVSFITEYKGLMIRTLQYYFNHKDGQKLIVTGTALEADKAKLDPVFDRAVAGLRFD